MREKYKAAFEQYKGEIKVFSVHQNSGNKGLARHVGQDQGG